MSYCR